MISYKDYFKGKKVTVLGLGLLGKRLGDIQFLSKMGAEVTVTDLKTAEELKSSVLALKGYKNIIYVLGEHRYKDFEDKDFILKGQGTPLDSTYISHARTHGIAIEMDESLFAKLAPEVRIIGITGTRGKTYTTELIYHILKQAKKRVHLGGNIKGTAALPLLRKVKPGDFAVFELSSWQLQGFGEAHISPEISVFTSFMPDHMNYYKNDTELYFGDKAEIFNHHTEKDVLIVRPGMRDLVLGKAKSKLIVASAHDVPAVWELKTPGEHTRENTACAIAVARHLKIPETTIKKAVLSFKGVPGRLEFVKKYKGVSIYNDTCATTPEATVAGLKALAPLSKDGKVILLAGGTDKALETTNLSQAIPLFAKQTVLLSGTGTNTLKSELSRDKIVFTEESDLKKLVKKGLSLAKKGDVLLFSPGFASFGMFTNEYDRGDQFVKIIKGLK
jgi:UDP-N-acetylmuramoylalanine--D-glutamate ligase